MSLFLKSQAYFKKTIYIAHVINENNVKILKHAMIYLNLN